MGENDTSGTPVPGQEFKPGDTVALGDQPTAPAPAPDTQPEGTGDSVPVASAPDSPQAGTTGDATVPETSSPEEAPSSENAATPGPFSAEAPTPERIRPASAAVNWTASEFIAHNKSFGWYAALAGTALVLAALIYLLTKDKISTGVVIVAAFAFGFYGARKPQQLEYALDGQGVHIGQRYYPFDAFRSFAVVDEGAFSSIAFRPHKRFGQLVTIYFDPQDEDAIIGLLSDRLPMEEHQRDVIDSFMRKIRF